MPDHMLPESDRRIVNLIYDAQQKQGEVLDLFRGRVDTLEKGVQAIHQTLHGPEGENGLYLAVKALDEKLDKLMKFKDEAVRDAKEAATLEAKEAEKRSQERADKVAKKAEIRNWISTFIALVSVAITFYVVFWRP